MQQLGLLSIRPTLRSSVYVVVIAVIASAGFIGHTPWPILLAALLTLPASIVALPGYYLGYGMLALIPGANPSSSTSSEVVAPDGTVISSVSTGDPAAWFTITTTLLGILALTLAAVLNVFLLRTLAARKRPTSVSEGAEIDHPGES